MTTIAREAATGAQLLPRKQRPLFAPRTITAWNAHLAADADQRAKFPEYAALAASITIHPATDRTAS